MKHEPKTDMPKTEKQIKLKDDKGTIPAGANVRWHPEKSGLCYVFHAGREWLVRVTSAFKSPSVEELEDWNGDGVCETPTDEDRNRQTEKSNRAYGVRDTGLREAIPVHWRCRCRNSEALSR